MNATDDIEVDHENHNTLDCRKENLRLATRSQNMANCRRSSKNTSGFKGVSFDKNRNKFSAKIWLQGKQIHLGRFENAEDAARVYDAKAKELFGEFAKLNFAGESSNEEIEKAEMEAAAEDEAWRYLNEVW